MHTQLHATPPAQRIASTLELILIWTYRTIRARYRQSVLGGLWAVLQPAATVAIFSVVFVRFVPIDTGDVPYLLFSSAAVLPWTLFSTSMNDTVDSLVSNMNLVAKIYFPREVLPIAAILARLFDFLIASSVMGVLMLLYKVPIFLEGLLMLPLIVFFQVSLSLGLGLIGAALNVFYRDLRQVFLLGLQVWFYATPVIYSIASVPKSILPYYFANPMAGIVVAYRTVLFDHTLPGLYFLYSACVAVLILGLGWWFFKRVEFQFADVV